MKRRFHLGALGGLLIALGLASPGHAANATFLTAQNYRAHTGPASLFAAPFVFDSRGWGDVAVVNQGSNDISYLTGTPFGSLGAPVNKPAPGGPVAVTGG